MPFEENWAVPPRPAHRSLHFSHSAIFQMLSTPNEPQILVLEKSLRLLSPL